LALEGGHSLPRVLHHKDYTGKHIMKQLHAKLKEFPTIQMLENTEVYELVHHPQLNEVSGAHLWDYQKQKNYTVQSSAVILGTGGVGSLFRYTTNPYTALGQGIALAEKAGAKAQD